MKAFNIEFYDGSRSQLIEEIQGAAAKRFSYVVWADVGQVVRAQQNAQLQQACARAAHRICATEVLHPAFELCKVSVPEAIVTTELSQTLLKNAEAQGHAVCVLGCDPRCMRLLKRRYPNIVFHHHYPPVAFIDNPDVAQACMDFAVDHPAAIVFIALGSPAQETLAMQLLDQPAMRGVGLCVGDALERIAETQEPAAGWRQRLKLDQLTASIRDTHRSAGCSAIEALRFVPLVVKQAIHERQARKRLEQAAAPNE